MQTIEHRVVTGKAVHTIVDGRTVLVQDDLIARAVLPEGEEPDWPAFVEEGIRAQGWRVVRLAPKESGLSTHGHADWRAVADALAASLRAFYPSGAPEDPSDADVAAQRALDGYDTAVLEVQMANAPHEHEWPATSEDDTRCEIDGCETTYGEFRESRPDDG